MTITPARLSASLGDLPEPVARALLGPDAGRERRVAAGGYEFQMLEWGPADGAPLLLIHGVTSSSAVWWRVGPALAAAGYRVTAIDLPGHGRTGGWRGRHRFAETAADVAAAIEAAGLAEPQLSVIGHSWGALTAANLPGAGIDMRRLILLDGAAVTMAEIALMLDDPVERRHDDLPTALSALAAIHPTWSFGDLRAKAEALTQFDEEAVRAVLLENEWDGGLAALSGSAARGIEVRIVRGERAEGGLLPDDVAAQLERLTGPGGVITIAFAPHTPHRLHPESTILALLRALGSDPG